MASETVAIFQDFDDQTRVIESVGAWDAYVPSAGLISVCWSNSDSAPCRLFCAGRVYSRPRGWRIFGIKWGVIKNPP